MSQNPYIVSTSCFLHVEKDRFFGYLSQLGIDKVEFCAASPFYSVYDLPDPAQRKKALEEWRDAFQKNGVEVYALVPEYHNYPLNLASLNPEIQARSVATYGDYIRDAGVLGTKFVYVNPGLWQVDKGPEAAFEQAAASLKQLLPAAEAAGVQLLVGPLVADQTNVLDDSETVVRMVEKVNSPLLRVAVELDTLVANGENPKWYLNTLGDRIACCRTGSFFEAGDEARELWEGYFAGRCPLVFNLEDLDSLMEPVATVKKVLANAAQG